MKAWLKSCVTILGVITVLAVILFAVLLPAIVLPFTANMNVASASDINSNLFKNSSFIDNTRGEAEYSSAGSNAVPTLDNWYISGYCSFDAYSLAIIPVNSTGRSGLLLQPIKLTNSGTYTVAINFKSVEQSMPRIEAFTNLLIDGVKIDVATSGASGHFYLNRLNNNLYVGTFTVTDSLLNSINSDSTLELAIGFGIISSCVLDFAKLEQGSDYTGYEPALSDFENLKSKYDALSLKYSQVQNELKILQDNYSNLLSDNTDLENRFDALQRNYAELQNTYNELQIVYVELQSTYNKLLSDFNNLASSVSFTVASRMSLNNVDTVEDHYSYVQSDEFYAQEYNGYNGIEFVGGAGDNGSIYNVGFYLPLSITVPRDTIIRVTWNYAITWLDDDTTTYDFGLLYGAIDKPVKILSTDVNYYVDKNTLQFIATDGVTNTLEFYCPSVKGSYKMFVSGLTISYSNSSIDALLQSKFEEGKEVGKHQGYDEGYRVGQEKGYAEGSKAQGDYTFLGLIGAVIDAPINSFRQMFDFEVLGVNLSSLVLSLFTISIILVIIKMVVGK